MRSSVDTPRVTVTGIEGRDAQQASRRRASKIHKRHDHARVTITEAPGLDTAISDEERRRNVVAEYQTKWSDMTAVSLSRHTLCMLNY